MAKAKSKAKSTDAEGSNASTLVGVRIKNQQFDRLEKAVAKLAEESPYTEVNVSILIRKLIDEFLEKQK